MRPQDIAILLKIISIGEKGWQYRNLSNALFITVSEVSNSLQRSNQAGLINLDTRKIHRQSFVEFLIHGLRYVFPANPGAMVTGIATAHSYPFYNNVFSAEMAYAWPYEEGNIRGLQIEPLYSNAPKAALQDEVLYKLFASIDILRVGRVREVTLASEELKKIIL